MTLTAVYEPVENGWVQAHLRELPEVITVAPTEGEVMNLLKDALAQYLAALDEPPVIGSRSLRDVNIKIASPTRHAPRRV